MSRQAFSNIELFFDMPYLFRYVYLTSDNSHMTSLRVAMLDMVCLCVCEFVTVFETRLRNTGLSKAIGINVICLHTNWKCVDNMFTNIFSFLLACALVLSFFTLYLV